MDTVEILPADLANPAHAQALVFLIDLYAREPVGGGKPLDPAVKARIVPGLAARRGAFVLLAFAESRPAGIAVCFEGYSTFAARPLLNLHDLAVAPEFRGRGLAKALLQGVEAEALRRGCCKLTLEVLEGNARAQGIYRAHGFESSAPGNRTFFFAKRLP